MVQILLILLSFSGILAAGCFGYFGIMFSAMGGWIIGVPLLLIGGAIGYFSLRQMSSTPAPSSSGETATSAFSEEAQAILANAATGDAESRYVAGKMFEHGEHGVPSNRDKALQWYRLAEAQGHAGAIQRLEKMAAE